MPCAVILTTLPVEYHAVRAHLTGLHEELDRQGTVYERGIFSANGQKWDVGIVQVGNGNARFALESERAIIYFNPDIILFVGIAGGIKDVTLGDVVASTKVYKYRLGEVEKFFSPRSEVGLSNYGLEQRARAESRKSDWLRRLSSRPSNEPSVFVAPIAAGEKVVATTASNIFDFLKSNYGDAIAVEMEGSGFVEVACANHGIPMIVIRGISDLIGLSAVHYDVDYQGLGIHEVASRHASAFAFELLAKLNFKDSDSQNSSRLRIERLLNEKSMLRKKIKSLSQDLSQLEKAAVAEIRESVHLRLKRQIDQTNKAIDAVEKKLSVVEKNISEITYSVDEEREETYGSPPGLELQYQLVGHEDFVTKISWSPNGILIAASSTDGVICIWERLTGKLYRKFEHSSVSVFDIAWSPDSNSLAVAANDCFIRIWNVETGKLCQKSEGLTDVAFDVAWSPDGETIALGLRNNTIQLWDVKTWQLRRTIEGHTSAVWVVAWSPDSRMLASGSKDQTIKLWEPETGKIIHTLVGHSSDVSSLSWSVDGQSLASAASHDLIIRIWNSRTGQTSNLLEGHTGAISCVAFSRDNRFLTSKSEDNTVKLWSCGNWEVITTLDEPMDSNMFRSLAFHPSQPLLATTSKRDHAILIWYLSLSLFESQKSLIKDIPTVVTQVEPNLNTRKDTVHHTSAKIVLVGESNVGKSCLALRLAEDRYEEQGSTHGMKLWTMKPDQLNPNTVVPEGEKRDLVLWDMGGQDEYRLVHQLFLHDTTLALILFDPTRGHVAFKEVEAWSKRLEKQLHGRKAIKLLVGTKLDEASSTIDQAGLERLVQSCGFAGYYHTSAKNKIGIDELRAAISQALDWSTIARISRPELFQTIRDKIEQHRRQGQVILFYSDLEDYIYQNAVQEFDRLEAIAVNDVVNQLALQGTITDTKSTSGERVLVLKIDEVERYAGSVIIAARNKLNGVPALEEQLLASPQMPFPGIKQQERLSRLEERTVLECIVQLLIQYGICLQHEGLLIFPALFQPTEKEGAEIIPHSISLYYDFSGAIDNIYSSLVTKLAISEYLGRVRLWEDRAEFKSIDQGACGIRKVERDGGFAHLDVYFEPETTEDTRNLFTAFIEEHLRKQGVEVHEHVEITCVCGYRFFENSIRKRVSEGHSDIGCPECDQRIKISEGAQQVRERDLNLESRLWALRTTIEDKEKTIIQEVKSVFERPDKIEIVSEPLRILHLSDLHIGVDTDPQSMLQPLVADVRNQSGGLNFEKLDYLVISGDLTNSAKLEEFEQARQFISGLIEQFQLSAERCIIVPGNHDLSWDEKVYNWEQGRLIDKRDFREGYYLERGDIFLVRNEELYPKRFKNFSEVFYHPLVMKEYPLKSDEQSIPYLFTDTRIQFLALNSCWEIDEFFPNRSGICDKALTRGLLTANQQIEQAKQRDRIPSDAKILRIVVWHHPITGNEKIQQDAFLGRLQQENYRLCLHGHIHEERTDIIRYLHPASNIHVAGTGSFGTPISAHRESTPRLYSLLEIERDHSKIKVHTRCLKRDGGAWEGWAVWPGQNATERRTYYEIQLGTEQKNVGKLKAIRKLMDHALDDDQLLGLCQESFPTVHHKFTAGQTKPQRVRLLLEHIQEHHEIPKLLAEIQELNPTVYAGFVAEQDDP
jgi:small GTP-binding protein